MSARYTTMVSDELIGAWDTSRLPEDLRIVEIGPPDPAKPFWRIVTFDDDEAPEELNGQMVWLLFQVQPDRTVIIAGREPQP